MLCQCGDLVSVVEVMGAYHYGGVSLRGFGSSFSISFVRLSLGHDEADENNNNKIITITILLESPHFT